MTEIDIHGWDINDRLKVQHQTSHTAYVISSNIKTLKYKEIYHCTNMWNLDYS